MLLRYPLGFFLVLQACLLLVNLDLLSLWGDELFTLRTVQRPVAEILRILQVDIHPPLYYLLTHWWIELPLPWGTLEKIRAFSALWMLVATVLLDRLLLRRIERPRRILALALWTLSPCAILYGRMGRSYAMQAAVTIAAAFCFWWLRSDPGRKQALISAVCGLLLLYTHYVPAIAAIAAFSALLLLDALRHRKYIALRHWCGALLLMAAGYLPWALTLTDALRRWSEASGFSSRYQVTQSALLEHGVKMGFGGVSLLLGESIPLVSMLLAVPFAVLLLHCLRVTLARREASFFLFVLAAFAGYLGVSRWVSYPFIPARLLWLLPFVWVWVACRPGVFSGWRRVAVICLLMANTASLVSYYRKANYLNKGYAAPLREIAAHVRTHGGGAVYVDKFNTDGTAFVYYAGRAFPVFFLGDDTALRHTGRVWVLRNTHDVSPGEISKKLEEDLCAGKRTERTGYVPYDGWQRAVMGRLGIAGPPEFFLQLTLCE